MRVVVVVASERGVVFGCLANSIHASTTVFVMTSVSR